MSIIEKIETLPYKKEVSKTKITIWFHDGNGQNYKVTWNLKAETTLIQRYYTNGASNKFAVTPHTLKGLIDISTHQEAEYYFY